MMMMVKMMMMVVMKMMVMVMMTTMMLLLSVITFAGDNIMFTVSFLLHLLAMLLRLRLLHLLALSHEWNHLVSMPTNPLLRSLCSSKSE